MVLTFYSPPCRTTSRKYTKRNPLELRMAASQGQEEGLNV
jgi:hypothetical protein